MKPSPILSYIGSALVLMIALLLVWAYFPPGARAQTSPSPSPSGCETTSTQSTTSPNGAWKAVTTENYCDAGYTFLTTGYYLVSLVNASNPTIIKKIFVVDDDGASTRPAISWGSNTTLNINTIHPYGNGLQLTSYSGIGIVYSYR